MVTKMKNGKTLGIMLAIANAVLAIVSVVLLEGIMAYDNVDGDLTDKIVVEKRIENQEQNSVVIFYAVSDSAGNVAKCSREFTAIYRIETEETDNQELQDGPLVQSGVWSVLEGGGTGGNSLADESVKGDGKETDGQDLDAGEAGEDESAGEEENEDGLEEEEGIEETEQQEQGQERDAGQQGQTPERDDGNEKQARPGSACPGIEGIGSYNPGRGCAGLGKRNRNTVG